MRLTIRSLTRSPGFVFTALATLAICLGANLVIYAAVNAILLRPLPFPEPDRLVLVHNSYPKAGAERSTSSIPNYFDRRGAIAAFASVSLSQEGSVTVGGDGAPNRVSIARITPEFFQTLGVALAKGRAFTDAELSHSADGVAILTDGFWRAHFNADPDIIGKTFLNDGIAIAVVGVLAPDFRFLSSEAQFYRPVSHDPVQREARRRHGNGWNMIARLAPGATLAEAQAQIDAFNAQQATDDPEAAAVKNAGYRTWVRPLHADHVREVRPMLLLLQVGVAFLLLIGLGNVANLLLIRASGRTKEIAVRQALGASSFALARGVLAETLLLALAGGALGLLLGAFGVDMLGRLGAARLPLGATIALDAASGAVALGASLAVGLLLAGPVVWFNRHIRLARGLQLESRGGTASRSARRVRNGFIVIQVALAFILLSGASLLGLSLKKAMAIPTGFNADPVLTGRLALPWKNYQTNDARSSFVARLLPALRTVPGITHAALTTGLPFTGRASNNAVTVEGHALQPGGTGRAHHMSVVGGDYWQAMGIPLVRGRFFTDADLESPGNVCIVDQAFADRYWPDQDPIGRRLAAGTRFTDANTAVVVGVVASVKQSELTEPSGHGALYFSYNRTNFNTPAFTLVMRAAVTPVSLASAARQAILALDPSLPLEDVRPMQSRIDDSLVVRRSPAILAAIFAGSALLLASIGLYGVMAYAVAQRTREFGIRLALGAAAADVLRMVLGEGARLAAVGLATGVVGSLLLTKYLATQLFAVSANNPAIYAAVAGLLALVAALACLLPAKRATKADPMIALRAE